MVTFENECVGCPTEMGCLGDSCSNMNVPHFYCDGCKGEVDEGELYDFDGEELCSDCLLGRFKKVRIN